MVTVQRHFRSTRIRPHFLCPGASGRHHAGANRGRRAKIFVRCLLRPRRKFVSLGDDSQFSLPSPNPHFLGVSTARNLGSWESRRVHKREISRLGWRFALSFGDGSKPGGTRQSSERGSAPLLSGCLECKVTGSSPGQVQARTLNCGPSFLLSPCVAKALAPRAASHLLSEEISQTQQRGNQTPHQTCSPRALTPLPHLPARPLLGAHWGSSLPGRERRPSNAPLGSLSGTPRPTLGLGHPAYPTKRYT